MICKVCKQDKKDSQFRATGKGISKTCNQCRKPKTTKEMKKQAMKDYKAPNGLGGKWSFDFKQLDLNTPDANYIYGLMVVLGKANPNLRLNLRKRNFMIVSSDKKIVTKIASFLKMDSNAVYELPRAIEKKEKSKWGLMLYHDDILPKIEKMQSFRREDFKKGKLEAERFI